MPVPFNESASYKLPKSEHLRRGTDFRRVYELRCSMADSHLIVYARLNGLAQSRVGFSVSRRVGNAVRRNRIRRLYREAYRLTKPHLPAGLDLVLLPRASDEPPLDDLKRSLVHLATRLAQRLHREAKKC